MTEMPLGLFMISQALYVLECRTTLYKVYS